MARKLKLGRLPRVGVEAVSSREFLVGDYECLDSLDQEFFSYPHNLTDCSFSL